MATRHVGVRLPQSIYLAANEAAERQKKTLADFIRNAIARELEADARTAADEKLIVRLDSIEAALKDIAQLVAATAGGRR